MREAEVGIEWGYDGGKRITGRNRHLAVDTLGLIVAVTLHGAYWQDHDGACFLLMKLRRICPRLKVLFADSAYGRNGLPQWLRETFGWVLQTVLLPVGVKGFLDPGADIHLAGPLSTTRLDYEHKTQSSKTVSNIAMINLMSERHARLQK